MNITGRHSRCCSPMLSAFIGVNLRFQFCLSVVAFSALMFSAPALAVSTNTWDLTNASAYYIPPADRQYLEVADGVAKLILRAKETFHTTFADYLGSGFEQYRVGIGPSVNIILTKSGSTYNAPGFFTSRVLDGGAGNTWQMLYARVSNQFFDNSTAEMSPSNETGLVALWHMNNNWQDATTNAYNGIAYNGATFSTSAKFGSHSGSFDGNNDFVSIGQGVNISSAITVSFWVKATAAIDGVTVQYPVCVGADRFTVRVGGYWDSRVGQPSGYQPYSITVVVNGNHTTAGTSAISNQFTAVADAGIWRHIVVTYDNNASPRTHIYKDGIELQMAQQLASGIIGAIDRIEMGRRSDNLFYWPGLIDETAIYNRVLSPEEVVKLYYAGSGLRFRVRSGTTTDLSAKNFVGPDGTTNSYYLGAHDALLTAGDFSISNRYAQYQAQFFSSSSGSETPYMESVGLFGTMGVQFDNTMLNYYAGEFTQNTTNFPYQAETPYIGLSKKENGGYCTNGIYMSRVFDASAGIIWQRIRWTTGEQLTNTIPGLIGLYHMDSTWADSAPALGNNDGTEVNPVYTDLAKLGLKSAVFDDGASSSHVTGFGGITTNIQAVSFWINDENPNDGIMSFSGGRSIYMTNHTVIAAGFTNAVPLVYVNGSSASKKLVSGWNHVAVVWSKGIDPSGMDVGVAGGDYLGGMLDEMAVYERQLTRSEIKAHYVTSRPTVAGNVKFQVRAANTTNALALAAWVPPAGYQDPVSAVFVIPGWFFQYRAILTGDGNSTPAFGAVSIVGNDGFIPVGFSDDSREDFYLGTFVSDLTRWYGDEMRLFELSATAPANIYGPLEADISGVWHLDESSWGIGERVYDTSGRGRNGDAYNGATPSPQAQAGTHCGYFDGVNDYVTLGFVSELNGDRLTVSTWVNSTDTNRSGIISTYSAGAPHFTLEFNGDGSAIATGKVAFVMNDGVSGARSAVSFMSGLNDGQWHHIAGVRDGGNIYIYVDGDQVGSTYMGASYGTIVNASPVLGRYGSDTNKCFKGYIDEVAIWSRALSGTEIGTLAAAGYETKGTATFVSAIIDADRPAFWETLTWLTDGPYGSPFSTNDPDLVALWHLDGDGTDSAGDSDGTVSGATSNTAGRFNACLAFDGANDWVAITDDPDLEPASFTIEAWVNMNALDSRIIFDKSNGSDAGYRLATDADGYPYFTVGDKTCWNSILALRVGAWTHVLGTYSGSKLKLYVDGELRATLAGSGTVASGDARIGADSGGNGDFAGLMDEAALHKRALTPEEILDRYRAAAATLKFQGRSGASPVLILSEPFRGPGGATNTYFEGGNWADTLAAIPLGRYFQYKAYFAAENHRLTPRLQGISVDSSSYTTNNPTVETANGYGFAFPGKLTAYSHLLATNTDSSVRYQVSGDNGTNWYFWGAGFGTNAWVDVDLYGGGWSCANGVSSVNINIGSLYRDFYEKTGGTFMWRAFLRSDGSDQVAIDSVSLGYSEGRIVVTSPNGAETNQNAWLIGTTNIVTWAHVGSVPGTVTIQYSLNSGSNWTTIASGVLATSDSQVWVTPGIVSDHCLVRVTHDTDPTIWDISDGEFQLVWRYRLVQHNGGPPPWYIGETNDIIWDAASGLGNVNLDFSGDNTWTNPVRIATSASSLGGVRSNKYVWVVPMTNVNLVSETAKIRVQTPGGSFTDYSDNFFTMAGAVVTVPAGGTKVKKDAPYNLTWKSAGCGANVKIEIQIQTGGAWSVVDPSAPNAAGYNIYSWMVTNQPTEEARIRITSLTAPRARGISDQFIIAAIEIKNPLGAPLPENADKWLMRTTQTIAWVSAGASDFINLRYLIGSVTNLISSNVPNLNIVGTTNYYNWVVEPTPSPYVRILVEDAGDPTNLWSMSPNDFHIAGVTILWPNGPESQEWKKDDPQVITWENNAVGDGCTVEISYDGGLTFTNVASVGFIDKATPPFAPTIPSRRALARITADDPTPFTNVTDLSDAYFSVAGVMVDEPTQAVEYTLGATNPVTFRGQSTHAPGYEADIYYAADGVNFDTNNPIKLNEMFEDETYPGVKTYPWVIETTRNPSEIARVKVVAGAYSAMSPVFTVRGVKFTAPAAGTIWSAGNRDIQFMRAGLNTAADGDLYLSLDGMAGPFTNKINAFPVSVLDAGYTWTVPAGIEPTTNAVIMYTITSSPGVPEDVGYTAYSVPFTLRGLRIVEPTNGASWQLGAAYAIRWKAAAAGNSADIFYSANGGTNYDATPIAQAEPSVNGTNTYNWQVEMSRTPSAGARIKVVTSTGITAESPIFVMNGIKVVRPISSDIYATTETNLISWIAVGDGGPYDLYYVKDGAETSTVTLGETSMSFDWYPNSDTNFITDNAMFDVIGAVYSNSSQIFKMVGKPTIAIVSPASNAYWKVGLTNMIEWSRGGKMSNDFTVWYSLKPYSSSNMLTDVVTYDAGSNLYRLAWLVPNQLTQAKIFIQHNTRADVNALSGEFNLVGRFRVYSPNGGEVLYALKPTPVSWRTIGSVPFVDLYYSITPPYRAASWVKINSAPVTNNIAAVFPNEEPTAVGWEVANTTNALVRFRVQEAAYTNRFDSGAEGPYDDSDDVFSIRYYTVFWEVFDFITSNRLDKLAVSDSSGWSASGLSCKDGSVISHNYPWGRWNTEWYREFFHDEVVMYWESENIALGSPPAWTQNVYMTRSEVEPDYHVLANFSYEASNQSFTVHSWLERSGKILDKPAKCTITVYDDDGNEIAGIVNSSPLANGVFWVVWDASSLSVGAVYYAKVDIEFSGNMYSSGLTFALRVAAGQEIVDALSVTLGVMEQRITNAVETVSTNLNAHEASQAAFRSSASAMLADIQTKAATTLDEMTNVVGALTNLTAVFEGVDFGPLTNLTGFSADMISNIADQLIMATEEIKRSWVKILTRPGMVKTGTTNAILYKTASGISPLITVTDPLGVITLGPAPMSEVPGTGVYKNDVFFDTNWGVGEFTIECRDDAATNSLFDSMVMTVVTEDYWADKATFDSISNQLVTVEAATSNIWASVGTCNFDQQFSNVFTAVSNVDAVVTGIFETVTTLTGLMGLTNLTELMTLTNIAGITPDVKTILTNVTDVLAGVQNIKTSTDTIDWSKVTKMASDLAGLGTASKSAFSELETGLGGLSDMADVVEVINRDAAAASTSAAQAAKEARSAKTQVSAVQGAVTSLKTALGEGKQETAMGLLADINLSMDRLRNEMAGLSGRVNLTPVLDSLTAVAGDINKLATKRDMDPLINVDWTGLQSGADVNRENILRINNKIEEMQAAMGDMQVLMNSVAKPPKVTDWWEAE